MEKFGGGRKQVEKFENKNNDRLIRGRQSTILYLMGHKMHSPNMPLIVGSLVEGKSRWRSLVDGETRWRSLIMGNWKIRIMSD